LEDKHMLDIAIKTAGGFICDLGDFLVLQVLCQPGVSDAACLVGLTHTEASPTVVAVFAGPYAAQEAQHALDQIWHALANGARVVNLEKNTTVPSDALLARLGAGPGPCQEDKPQVKIHQPGLAPESVDQEVRP
jgi:hypothetical protein